MTFNTIIVVGEVRSAEENLKAWLEAEYDSLRGKTQILAGKAEYGIKVFRDVVALAKSITETSLEVKRLEEEIGSKPRGLAYMYRQKLESTVSNEVQRRTGNEIKELYDELCSCAADIRLEKVKRGEDAGQMLLNLSLLVSPEKYPELEARLDRIRNRDGYSLRLTGPLPPYSFC